MAMPSEQHPTISEPDSETEPISRNERASSAQPDSNANPTLAHRTGFWNVVWDSLKGTREDYTSGELFSPTRWIMVQTFPYFIYGKVKAPSTKF
jgi:hypothetical protein